MVPVDNNIYTPKNRYHQEQVGSTELLPGREQQIPWFMSMFPYENYHLEVINHQMFRKKICIQYTSYCLLEIPLSQVYQVYPIKSPHHIP